MLGTKTHGIIGNEKAKVLANRPATTLFVVLEPFCGIRRSTYKNVLKDRNNFL